MFKKVLIANRGEIAVRIIRACRDMGIFSVAVYSEADEDALHTQIADESICIGSARSKDSYLNIENIITAAICSGAEAIHPGFGFLSENATFAKKCEENNIIFIGPKSETIALMGDKIKARETANKAGLPMASGGFDAVKSSKDAKVFAGEIGYPVMLKAASGGGGKGIRIVECEAEIEPAFNSSSAEALSSFGDDRLYMEKYIINPKHIEIQILADKFGNVVHLFERECSLQRKQQKMVEEAPSMFLDDKLRRVMGEKSVELAKLVGYIGAGTIEFLVDSDKNFYFCEMNTRVQVEHPVTEFITGVDIICEQIKIAYGEKLSIKQDELKILGHSIECRINAENPENNFAPCPGKINSLFLAGGIGVRIDTAVYDGYTVPPYYDSMIAKLIVFGATRDIATARMKRALTEMLFDGISTNVDFQLKLINSKIFETGNFHTKSIENGDFND